MLTFNNTLETLKLKYSVLLDVPGPVCIKSLTTLYLSSVEFKDDESFRNLISGCPNLKYLFIRRGYRKAVLTFHIVAPSLEKLSIYDCIGGLKDGGYVINAPCLKYLKIRGMSHSGCCFIENAPMLVKANISNISNIANQKVMGSLNSAKRICLDVSPLEIKCPTGSIFYQLVYLEVHTHRVEWWNLLMLMLHSSPKLQLLKLTYFWSLQQCWDYSRNNSLVGAKWSEPKHVPECLFSHLETFVWTRYNWEREEEKEVANYILKNARLLKKATFSVIESKDLNTLEERREVLKDLEGVVRASNSCHLVFVE